MKSEVFSWRLSPQTKQMLEEAARRERISVSRVLETIVQKSFRDSDASKGDEEAALQAKLHSGALRWVGKIKGARPGRSASAQKDLRRKLRQHHERTRSH